MSDYGEPSVWTKRWADLTLVNGLSGPVMAVLGSYGTGLGRWNETTGLVIVAVGLISALFAIFCGIIALLKIGNSNLSQWRIWMGLVPALGLSGLGGYAAQRIWNAPPVHDVTTSLANPPAFTKLPLRADNLVGSGEIGNWRVLHANSYSQLQPLILNAPVAEITPVVVKLIKKRGWDIALVGPDRVEATETWSPFHFKDDMVILVTPLGDGRTSQVDMRSVSRTGVSDWGSNAERIQAFLNDLTHAKGPKALAGV